MCSSNNKTYSEGKDSWEDLSDTALKFLMVDDNHGIIYCFVPKVRPEIF